MPIAVPRRVHDSVIDARDVSVVPETTAAERGL